MVFGLSHSKYSISRNEAKRPVRSVKTMVVLKFFTCFLVLAVAINVTLPLELPPQLNLNKQIQPFEGCNIRIHYAELPDKVTFQALVFT